MPAPNPVKNFVQDQFLKFVPYGSYQERVELFENFLQRPIFQAELDPAVIDQASQRLMTGANRDWIATGLSFDPDPNSLLDPDGGCLLRTFGATNDTAELHTANAINGVDQSEWRKVGWFPQNAPRLETIVELADPTDIYYRFGLDLTNAFSDTADDDQALIQFDSLSAVSTTNWTIAQSVGGVDTFTDTGVVFQNGVSVRLAIEMDDVGVPNYFINNTKVLTGEAMTLIANLIPFAGVRSHTNTQKQMKTRTIRGTALLPLA